jgi:tRNA pseudouridine55 synthase
LLPLLGDGRKAYEFDLVLGFATKTGDASGIATTSGGLPDHWDDALPGIVASLVGPLSQVPPMYSAVKVDGQPLYKSARRGEEVTRPARVVDVYSLRILGSSESRARLALECSAGTYVRTLCEEIGRRLDVPAHMDRLVRTMADPFKRADSCGQEALLADPFSYIIDPLTVLTQPRVALRPDDVSRFTHGNVVTVPGDLGEGEVSVTLGGRMAGTGRIQVGEGGARLRPTRVFI